MHDREALLAATLHGETWVVGGTVRDELLGRATPDLDLACHEPESAARTAARVLGGTPFPLSGAHGAWRVAFPGGGTVDAAPLAGSIEDDLAKRDFTVNAIARPLGGGPHTDPFGGREDLEERVVRAVSAGAFEADPLRLLRAVRFEDELGFRMEARTERLVRERAALVTRPSGERILETLERLSVDGWLRLADLGLLGRLGGSLELARRAGAVDDPSYRLVAFLQDAVGALPISRELRRYAVALLRNPGPGDGSVRAVHRLRRATEPWTLDALALAGRLDLAPAVEAQRGAEPAAPLVRGDELAAALGLRAGPEVGRLLAMIDEERAAGAVTTREEAIAHARRHTRDGR